MGAGAGSSAWLMAKSALNDDDGDDDGFATVRLKLCLKERDADYNEFTIKRERKKER